MALSDFWELKDNQVLAGKNILNVYHVKRIKTLADATEVATAFINTVLDDGLIQNQAEDLTRTTIDVANLGDPTDFISIDSSSLPGQLLGEWPAAFNVAAIQFNRTRNDMKNGQKRFTMFDEGAQADGVYIASAIAVLEDLRDDVMGVWQIDAQPGVDIVEFCILKRFCIVPAQDPCVAYRLPDTDAEADDNHYVPIAGVVRANVKSQVSRKI